MFCTTALFTWKLDATDVSRMAGHANDRITLDMYVGTTAGVLDRARTATDDPWLGQRALLLRVARYLAFCQSRAWGLLKRCRRPERPASHRHYQ